MWYNLLSRPERRVLLLKMILFDVPCSGSEQDNIPLLPQMFSENSRTAVARFGFKEVQPGKFSTFKYCT